MTPTEFGAPAPTTRPSRRYRMLDFRPERDAA
jgi:hypothetical protein